VTRRVRVTDDGAVLLRLSAAEHVVLEQLPDQLAALLQSPAGDPALERLFPRAYSDPAEEVAEHEWQALAQPALLRERFDAIDVVRASLSAEPGNELVLSPEEADAWLRVLNDLRLVLGVRRDATDVYEVLTVLQDDLIGALLG
jgi:hypothetical protein